MTGMILVFGSNTKGRHGKGAALYAREHCGAIYGQGEGLQGQSYAIPTKGEAPRGQPMPILPLHEIEWHVARFLQFAAEHPELTFKVTAIGTGLAGYTHEEMAPLFARRLPNVFLPTEWQRILFFEDAT